MEMEDFVILDFAKSRLETVWYQFRAIDSQKHCSLTLHCVDDGDESAGVVDVSDWGGGGVVSPEEMDRIKATTDPMTTG